VYRTDQARRYFSPMDPEGLGLLRMARLLDALGHPERAPGRGVGRTRDQGEPRLTSARILHVAGTKGKGSVCAMLDACLRLADVQPGLFPSPHLHSYRERIRVNGEPIPADHLSSLIGELRSTVERLEVEAPDLGTYTTFELTLTLALLHFRAEAVEAAVIET